MLQSKLDTLAHIDDSAMLLQENIMDSVNRGCELCGTQTVKSAMILAGGI